MKYYGESGARAAEANVRPRSMPLMGVELSVVVPTFNEVENVAAVVASLHAALDGVTAWEVIFVDDDSSDGTAETVKLLAQEDAAIRCMRRVGRRGLSSACIEGILASAAPLVAVMDADLQHDEQVLPLMVQTLRAGDQEIVVGTRYDAGGSVEGWDARRLQMSRLATRLAKIVTKVELSDPMSGFFAMRRSTFDGLAPRLSGVGFKLLLDIFATSKIPLRFAEVPYHFRNRLKGESKLDSQVAWDFLMMLAEKTVGPYVPVKFLSFSIIGASGVLLHLAVFYLLFGLFGQTFVVAKIGAVTVSIISNFALNNVLTYRDRRKRGWRWLTGLATFSVICSIGAAADVGISSYIFSVAVAGSFLRTMVAVPVLAGVVIGAVWNYAVSSAYTWKKP